MLWQPEGLARPRRIYSLNDLKSLQDWTLERLFRRVPRIADVASYGGTVKRYEIHPDPARMQRYGITLQQLKDAIASSNANVGAEYVVQGEHGAGGPQPGPDRRRARTPWNARWP